VNDIEFVDDMVSMDKTGAARLSTHRCFLLKQIKSQQHKTADRRISQFFGFYETFLPNTKDKHSPFTPRSSQKLENPNAPISRINLS